MKKKSFIYSDLSKKQLENLKEFYIQKKVESMSHKELKEYVQEIISHHKFEEGALSYLTGGSHIGETAVVKAHEIKRSSKDNEVTFEEDFGTISDYVFIIGAKKDIPLEVNE